LCCRSIKVIAATQEFLVYCLHAFRAERAGVFALLLTPLPKARILGGIVRVSSDALEHTTRAEHFLEPGSLGVVGILRLVLRVEVVKIAEEFVEPVNCRQKLVTVAEVVLAVLAGRVALRLQQLSQSRVLVRQSFLGTRQPDLKQAGTER
jgi:hypothetical protein